MKISCHQSLEFKKLKIQNKNIGFYNEIKLWLHCLTCNFCKLFTKNEIEEIVSIESNSIDRKESSLEVSKLPISVGILSWNAPKKLLETLITYQKNNFLERVNDVCILFNEFSKEDIKIAEYFGMPYISYSENLGIGKAFLQLAAQAKTDKVLLLENDWHLIESENDFVHHLQKSILLLENGFDVVRLRSRKDPGYPHFSFSFKGRELTYYDEWHQLTSPHLLDAIHWVKNPEIDFNGKIEKNDTFYTTTSRYGNWTNNPCLFKKEFYIKSIEPFVGEGIDLERKIAYWWPRQNFKVAHGEGLFKHVDTAKYGDMQN